MELSTGSSLQNIYRVGMVNNQREMVGWETKSSLAVGEFIGQAVLELVSIPGSTLLMGSATEEIARYTSEDPQHKVTVFPFLMGQYPVTQAQWRTVASLPKVKINLSPDPSYFK